jgi:hypothetical protein
MTGPTRAAFVFVGGSGASRLASVTATLGPVTPVHPLANKSIAIIAAVVFLIPFPHQAKLLPYIVPVTIDL